MKRTQLNSSISQKWKSPILLFSFFSLLILTITFLQSKNPNSQKNPNSKTLIKPPKLPKLAYLITGTKNQVPQIERLMLAIYHPRNYYVLHLDLEASNDERLELSRIVRMWRPVKQFRNVFVVGKADLITDKGPTVVASLLHGVSLLFKRVDDWDWFFNLCASDYPLISQDDLLHIFSHLPRDLNFLEHTSDLGWKEHQRARPIIIDPGLYHLKKSGVFSAKEKRSLPYSFKLFTGSEWMVLTKSFLDFCIWGRDNLPRTLLMYYTNFLFSAEGYFHTVVCNHKNYQNTTVNHDLRYVKFDNTQNQQPVNLTLEHFNEMVQSGAPFAHRFNMNDPVLEKIDRELLGRVDNHFVRGQWCVGSSVLGKYPCDVVGTPDAIKPSLNSKRLEKLMLKLLDPEIFRSKQCR